MERTFEISATRDIDAAPAAVYAVFADYRDAHPRILPPRFFVGLHVEEGGYGAGTRLVVKGRFAGRTRALRGVVTVPEPGRRLVETYPDEGMETWFDVVPKGEDGARVTISSRFPRRRGPLGWLEERMVRRLMPRVYAEELDRTAALLAGTL